jgi:iron complex outermembrane receptor protein
MTVETKGLLLTTCISAIIISAHPAAASTGGRDATLLPASTQTPAPSAAASSPENASTVGSLNEEIVVTAQRRSGSLERTPVAVAVLSSEMLVKRAVTTESDLQIATPGLTIRQSQNSNQINYAIRGQSLDAFSNTRPGVLPYVDEVQVGGNAGASAFYDLQSVQVLKGPQGTLFGRNATGGAVLFTTQRPTDTLSGYLIGRLGNFHSRYLEGAINVPLASDKVLLRVAGVYDKRDGFQQDLFQNERAGNVDRYGVRASLTIKPVEGIKNDLVVDYFHSGGNSSLSLLSSLNPTGAIPLIALTNFGNQAQFDSIIGAFIGNQAAAQGSAAAFAAANPKLDPGGLASFLAAQKARGPYRIESNGPNSYLGRTTLISNITSIDVAPDTQIRNVIGYTHVFSANAAGVDGTPYGIDDDGTLTYRTHQFSEEIQVLGKGLNSRLSYVAGFYYSAERQFYSLDGQVLDFPFIRTAQSYAAKNTNRTFAGYAQGTYDLSEIVGINGLGVTGGVRYTIEKVGYVTQPQDISKSDPASVQATYDFDQSKTFKNLSWTTGIQEQLDQHTLVYVASRRSYRNGGFNASARPIPGPGTEGGNGYGAERVTDVELGAKFNGRVANLPLRANLALYRNWINDSQRVAYTLIGGSPSAVTVNVPKSRVRGVEFDTSLNVTNWLQLGGSVNYTDAKFTDNLVSIAGAAPTRLGTYPDTPKWSGSAFGEVSAPITPDLTGSLRADLFGQTSTFYTSSGNTNPLAKNPGYKLVNLRLGLSADQSGWSIAAIVKNIFDRTYYVGGIGLGELFQLNTTVPGDRRTIAVEGRFRF